MDGVFLKLLNMSISAVWVVGIVLILRFLLKKAPKWTHCTLWALVAVRLICPFSFESALSLLPSNEVLPSEIIRSGDIQIHTGFEGVDNRINSGVLESYMEGVTVPVGNTFHILTVFTVIWLIGMLLMAGYALFSYLRLKGKVAASVETAPNVRVCDYITSPFILGICRPAVYLPSSMDPQTAVSVIAHETAHIRRKDHWWKPLGYLLLTIHWFNPVIWLAYILLCRDIEMACDEKVIRDMDPEQKKRYSEALLSCSMPRRMIAACPLAFGEVGVKERVKGILNYKKPAFWLILVAIVACAVAAVCFLTDPAGMTLAKQFGFSKLDAVTITAGEQVQAFPEREDRKKVEDFLKSARLEPLPISQNRSEDRPKDFGICLSDGAAETWIYFDGDFSDVWADDGVKPSLSYRMEDPDQVRGFFEAMLGMDIPMAVSGGPDENGNYYFYATVLRVSEKQVLVEPLEGCWERGSSDMIWVSLNFQSEETPPEIRIGDRIKIVYNGMVAETYPAQVDWVFNISVEERILSDSMLQEIVAAVGESDIDLFDYQTVGSCRVFGCKYGNRHGVVYLDQDGTLTIHRQESIMGRDDELDFIYDTSHLNDGYISVIVTNPTVFALYTVYGIPEQGNVKSEEYTIHNFPALVVMPASRVAMWVYCIDEDGSRQALFGVR